MAGEETCVRHLDLFSGIGGFAYAARVVWGELYRNVGFCEIDPFCQSVLRKNFPDCTIYEDIRTLANDSGEGLERGDREKPPQSGDSGYVDLITGGFPCQPFSTAGRRRGTSDDRYLWPEMFRVIQRFKPTWIIAENVGGLVTWNEGMVLEQVCSDLESKGYEVQPLIIPACAVNAPHRRDRIWIVAHAIDGRQRREEPEGNGASDRVPQKHRAQNSTTRQPIGADSVWQANRLVANSNPSRSQESWSEQQTGRDGQSLESYPDWERNWQEVALATCHDRVDDGFSRRVVRLPLGGSPIGYAKWRKEALKAYGNAIVPQVAMMIMEAIREV